MRAFNWLLAMFFVFLLLNSHIVHSQIYSYKNYTHREGLTLNSTEAIVEKEDGSILIGTNGAGIIEFDGYKFRDLFPRSIQDNHHVTDIKIIDDKIYFSSRYMGIFVFHNKKIEVVQINLDGNCNGIEHYKRNLFFITEKYIYTYNLDSKKITTKTDKKHNLTVYQHIETEYGIIFLTNNGNFIFTKNNKFVPLTTFFKNDNQLLKRVPFGYYNENVLYLYDSQLEKKLSITDAGNTYSIKEKKLTNSYNFDDISLVDATYNSKKECFAFVATNGNIYEEQNEKIQLYLNNSSIKKLNPNKIVYNNVSYWLTTRYNGIFKIGEEPFTRLNFHPELAQHQISTIFQGADEQFVFSDANQGITFTGYLTHGNLEKHLFSVYSTLSIDNHSYLGTENGINEFVAGKFKQIVKTDDRVTFLLYQAPYVWVGVLNKGLFKYDKNFKLIKHYEKSPIVIHTGKYSSHQSCLYLGTNNGVVKLDLNKEEFSRLDNHKLGFYTGLSTVDAFGTIWFSLEKGLLGYNKQGKTYVLDDPSLFTSCLFYTLNSDDYGNIVIGTNKGLNFIQVNEKGIVINSRNFLSGLGFDGYETHTRSTFQSNINQAYSGTAEGVYLLNFKTLQSLRPPKKPVIEKKLSSIDSSVVSLSFLSKNPKINNVLYSYRILNVQNKWSEPSKENSYVVPRLSGGTYTLEVKASYDGVDFSEVSREQFKIDHPFLRDNLMIAILIVIVMATMVFYYNKSKENASFQLFYSDEIFNYKYTYSLVLFAMISHTISSEIVIFVSNDLKINQLSTLTTSVLLFLILLRVSHNKNIGKVYRNKVNLIIAFLILSSFSVYSLYDSNLHPFYGFYVILVSATSPFIINKTKHVTFYSIGFLAVNSCVIYLAQDVYYDKFLLFIPIIISGIMNVMMSIIRHDSIQQLAFISSVINKSNVLAIAMNSEGKLIYMGKNISNYIRSNDNELIGKSIDEISQFVPQGENFFDFNSEFRDGKQLKTPFVNEQNEVFWFEWTFKKYQEDIRVIVGQDITEKIKLQSTYEILVENAEDLIYQVDVTGEVQFVNSRFDDYLSYDKDLLVGKKIAEILPPEYKQSMIDNFNQQLQSKEKISYFTFPILNKENEVQWFGQYVTVLYEADNETKPIGFLAVARNITDKLVKDSIITSQSESLRSSINYAKRIQLSLLPSEEKLNDCFSESFILYKPKDVVSGDFYWCNQIDEHTVIAVGDGTGHGIPGALMSVIAINLLNSIVLEKKIHDPGRVLNELDSKLKKVLQDEKNGLTVNDGFEIAVCVINENANTMEYACAGSKIIIHDGSSFSIRKGDNKHIGDEQKEFQGYVTHYYSMNNDTTVYFFTDGYYNQFGGVSNKKFSIKRLLEMFMQNIRLPLSAQKEMFEQELEEWKANEEQTDDITIVGFRKTND